MYVEGRIGGEKNQTRCSPAAGRPMRMAGRHIKKIAVMRNHGFIAFHLHLQSAAHDHDGFTWRMPMERSHTAGSEARKNHRCFLRRVSFLDGYSEALRCSWNCRELGLCGRCRDRLVLGCDAADSA